MFTFLQYAAYFNHAMTTACNDWIKQASIAGVVWLRVVYYDVWWTRYNTPCTLGGDSQQICTSVKIINIYLCEVLCLYLSAKSILRLVRRIVVNTSSSITSLLLCICSPNPQVLFSGVGVSCCQLQLLERLVGSVANPFLDGLSPLFPRNNGWMARIV